MLKDFPSQGESLDPTQRLHEDDLTSGQSGHVKQPRDNGHGETRAGPIDQKQLGLVGDDRHEAVLQGLESGEHAADIGLAHLKMSVMITSDDSIRWCHLTGPGHPHYHVLPRPLLLELLHLGLAEPVRLSHDVCAGAVGLRGQRGHQPHHLRGVASRAKHTAQPRVAWRVSRPQ